MQPGCKYPVYSCKDFTIYFERIEDGPLMLHVDYFGTWSKNNKKIFQGVLDDICSGLREPLLALPFITDRKMEKFTKICRLVKIQDFECSDKVVRPLYMRSN